MLTETERSELIRRADELYHPCSFGIHVCGDKDGEAATVANVYAHNEAQARAIFEAAKAEAAGGESGDEFDLVVDLNLGPDNLHVEDFCIRRQMLDRCLSAARAVAA